MAHSGEGADLSGARAARSGGGKVESHKLEEAISLSSKDDDKDDMLQELFGEVVIFSYTDEQAVADGVLIPFMVGDKDTRHRITSNAHHELKEHYQAQGYDYDDARYLGFFFHELLALVPLAVKEYRAGGILRTDYNFRVVKDERQEILWYLPNEIGGVTMMKPEDY